jgi:hypothetical protein
LLRVGSLGTALSSPHRRSSPRIRDVDPVARLDPPARRQQRWDWTERVESGAPLAYTRPSRTRPPRGDAPDAGTSPVVRRGPASYWGEPRRRGS